MSDDQTSTMYERILQELRRLGRATVAAQAAAEASHAALDLLLQRERMPETKPPETPAPSTDEGWLEALLTFSDALDRTLEARRPPAWWRRPGPAELALPLLRAQLDAVLRAADIELQREVGVEVDPQLHRVVETAPGPESRVIRVLRPAAWRGGRLLREADVVAGASS